MDFRGSFKRDKTGWVLVILNLIMAVNSTLYFTTQLKAGWSGWLAMNSCAPSILVFSIGYLLNHRILMAVGAGCMFRFGTLGLLVFGWDGMNIIPQIGHILMTAAVFYFTARMIALGSAEEIIAAGCTALVLLYSEWQWGWFGRHPGIIEGLMRGALSPEMFK